MFKCYNFVHGASTSTGNNPVHFFGKPLSASLWKTRCSDLAPSTYGDSIVFLPSDNGVPVLMPWQKFKQNMLTVLSLAALMSTKHFLESQHQTRQESSGFIDLFTVYYAAATQI